MDSGSDITAAHGRQKYINGVTIAFLVISWAAVSMRLYVRAFMIKNFGWDDAVMLLAAISNTIYAAFNFLLISYGFGNPQLLLEPPAVIAKVTTYLLATFGLYAATMIIVKISLGIFFLRIVVSTWQRWTIYSTVFISTVFGTYYFFAALFQCGNPTDFLENAYAGKCGDTEALFPVNMTAGVINAASDLIMVVLPMFLIRKACMPLPAKLSACFVIALGSVGGIISLVRLKFIPDLTYGSNFFETGVSITIWSIVEVGICITAASLATLRPLFKCCVDRTRQAMTSSHGSTAQKGSQLSSLGKDGSRIRPDPPASLLSFQDRGVRTATSTPGGFKLSPVTSNGGETPNHTNYDKKISANAPPVHDYEQGFTRRASVHRGKVRWDDPSMGSPTPPLPPPLHLPVANSDRQSGHGIVPQNSPAHRSPTYTPPESPIIPVGPSRRTTPEATVQKSTASESTVSAPKRPSWKKSLSPSWPKSPMWPKPPSKHSRPPPLRQASMQWNPPGERPLSMRENSYETLPTQHPYFRESAVIHTQEPKVVAVDRPVQGRPLQHHPVKDRPTQDRTMQQRPTKNRQYNEPPSQPRTQPQIRQGTAPAYTEIPRRESSRQRFPVAPACSEVSHDRVPSHRRFDPVPAYSLTPMRRSPDVQHRYGTVASHQPYNPGPPPPPPPPPGDLGPYGNAYGSGDFSYTSHGDVEQAQAVRHAAPRPGRQGGFI